MAFEAQELKLQEKQLPRPQAPPMLELTASMRLRLTFMFDAPTLLLLQTRVMKHGAGPMALLLTNAPLPRQ